MKKQVLFVALATIFSMSVFAQEAVRPDTAMGKPAHEAEDVMAIYCNHYATNNLHYDVQRWVEGIVWEELTLGADSTKVYYCPAMSYEGLASNPIEVRDFSGYKKLHFDVWAPEACRISLTVETEAGVKHHCPFGLNAGWNTIDADPAWWDKEGDAYDWKDVKFLIFDQYKTADDAASFDGNPFAFANIYFWNDPAPENIPAEAPAAPTLAESKVMALFSSAYQTRTYNFTAMNWGNEWIDYAYTDGQHIYHWESFAWGGFGGSEESYALPESPIYDMMHADVYVTVDSKLKFTFEANGGRWKNGAFIDLEANKWNSVTLDLLNAPYDTYDFSDFRYLILEGFEKAEGGSAEGTPLSIGNVYFYSSMDQAVENVEAGEVATKRIIDGKLVIIKNGVQYTVLGTQF